MERDEEVTGTLMKRATGRRWLLGVAGAGLLGAVALVLGLLLAFGAFEGGGPVGPKLSVEDTVRLEMRLGESGERVVSFRNGGTEPLSVKVVKTRAAPDSICGCGITSSEVRPQEVMPGDTGELVFSISAEGMTKPMKDKLLVDLESNDPSRPNRTITILLGMTQ